ncbi:MAG: sensor histidine kinase [Kineosporiaceae bacterium]|jgi:signal transduction histidine kinase
MWQIVHVRLAQFRQESQYLPLLLRALLLLLGSLLTASVDGFGPAVAVAPALLLLFVAALGSVPIPPGTPRSMQSLAEALSAAVVVGSLHGKADLFLPYLLVPLVSAGLNGGMLTALAAAGIASAALGVSMTVATTHVTMNAQLGLATWAPMFVAVALVAAWSRRIATSEQPASEPAYADAHRLLSELHVVARQLSLGLEPQTLAAALADDASALVPGTNATVLVRSAGGRFVPLVGTPPDSSANSVVLDAWLTADVVRRGQDGTTVVALPVLMGERVVAVVVLTGPEHLDETHVAACRKVVSQAGTRLASALLFDDVRRLATDDERLRLAREIHDGIAQDLASVGYLIDDIADTASPDVHERLMALREHITGLVGELRLSIFDLRTGVDEAIGLSRTLGDYVQRVGTQAGLIVHVSTDESPHRLPVATEVELLRIVQEAVTNVRRHAEATNVWLSVVVDPPYARIAVTDDGRGLQQGRPDSMGITGMKERARRIGATLRVESRTDGPGTVVDVCITSAPNALSRTRNATTDRPSVADSGTDGPGADRTVLVDLTGTERPRHSESGGLNPTQTRR